jgi:murein DD-endopeptidase MepM/ murein hydrolase activator NlpD
MGTQNLGFVDKAGPTTLQTTSMAPLVPKAAPLTTPSKPAKRIAPAPAKDRYVPPTTSTIDAILQSPSVPEGLALKFAGRRLTDLFYRGNFETLWTRFFPQLKEVYETPHGLKEFYRKFYNLVGQENRILSEEISRESGKTIYTRHAKGKKEFVIRWTWDDSGAVVGLRIHLKPELAPSRFLKYKTKTSLILPFQEQWLVFWGGHSLEQNRHATVSNQRFAYDFDGIKEGKTFKGEGKRNEDYYCFGRPVFAPGAGKVIAMENSVPENIPGETNPKHLMGNYVIIDHLNGEYSFLAHFKRGSVQVKVGDIVQQGQALAQCGNTGNSSEPHLHYHLQNKPSFEDGEGLPAQFNNYRANGEAINKGEPVKNQIVEQM